MRKSVIFLFFILLPVFLAAQNSDARPKIGLALSGGGAKGLAHIGLLMAIDSAQLNVDYISGTSMGAIVGGLYSVGYSGREIANLAREMQWSRILSDRLEYGQLLLPYKEESRQFINVPLVNGRLFIGTGLLESNELWLWLSEHFSSYNRKVQFKDLPRPFRCVATRLNNGEVVILDEGNLVRAIRASMAIPSVFTSVNLQDEYLIDGGLVRNLPVSEVLDMGATFTIGSSVTDQQLSKDDISNPMEMFSQIAFYTEKRDYREQLELTDIFIDYPIGPYNAGSFSSADKILQIGIDRGNEIFPILKNLKDSLDLIYGPDEFNPPVRPASEKFIIRDISYAGLDTLSYDFFTTQIDFRKNREYTPADISNRIRNSLASGIFKTITYHLDKNADSTFNIHLDFERDYRTYARAGLGYNAETGLGIKLGLSWSSLLSLFSKTSIGVSIGENQQFSARNLLFFGGAKSLYLESSVSGEFTELNLFNRSLAETGKFRQDHISAEINLLKLWAGNFQIGPGTRWEWLTYNPEIQSVVRPKGTMNFLNSYLLVEFNNQDQAYNPHRGNKINLEMGWTYNQNLKFSYTEENEADPQPVEVVNNNYPTLRYSSHHYLPVNRHTLYFKLNAGMHFGNKLPYLNSFMVGGNNIVTRNQILFPGFRVNGLSTSSAATAQFGLTINFTSKFSLSAGASALMHDFISGNFEAPDQTSESVGGINLTAGYNTFLGPIEIALMYNTINQKVITGFNLGYSMNFSD